MVYDLWPGKGAGGGGGGGRRRFLEFSFQLQRATRVASGRQSQRDNVKIVMRAENEPSCSFGDMHSDQREEPIKET